MARRFQIGDGPIYTSVDLGSMQMTDILLLEQQTAAMGMRVTWADVMAWTDELVACETDAERIRHPKAPWITAVTVWATKRLAGELVSFSDAVDFPMSDLHFLPEPEDYKPPANPTGAAPRKKAPRKASARGGATARASSAGGSKTRSPQT